MTDPLPPPAQDPLAGFDSAARAAVLGAEQHARELGHGRVGTEHLLLGLLGGESSGAASVLHAAGVTLSAARHKAAEAVGSTGGADPSRPGPLPRTPRADRALGRALRFSHYRHAPAVGTEHLLLGVLDVEGTAGQVLRTLGLDLDRLRVDIDPGDAAEVSPVTDADTDRAPATLGIDPAPVRCPACRSELDGRLSHRPVVSREVGDGARPARTILAVACDACGTALGFLPG